MFRRSQLRHRVASPGNTLLEWIVRQDPHEGRYSGWLWGREPLPVTRDGAHQILIPLFYSRLLVIWMSTLRSIFDELWKCAQQRERSLRMRLCSPAAPYLGHDLRSRETGPSRSSCRSTTVYIVTTWLDDGVEAAADQKAS